MQIMLTKGADSHSTNQALLIAIVVAELMQKILGDGSTKRASSVPVVGMVWLW